MRILNLYAGIGGNRKMWHDADVTAVENNAEIAAVYAAMYPQDTIIIKDAHQYLLDHYHEFDFIWSSPPCQTHSAMRQQLAVRFRGTAAVYADMRLYQEIIFLHHNFRGLWVVENVKPYYTPLIAASTAIQRHLFWANFPIAVAHVEHSTLRSAQIAELQTYLGIDISAYNIANKRQILRNCVLPTIGEHVLLCARRTRGGGGQ